MTALKRTGQETRNSILVHSAITAERWDKMLRFQSSTLKSAWLRS
jgi:hypothetical protein